MARDRLGADYSESMNDATTCSCIASSEKCSLGSCGSTMFQEPFFLHPPGSRPRDGLYINPMSSPFQSDRQKDVSPVASNGSESFYLHSPHDVVYTRITHLFDDDGGGGGGGLAPVIAERASSASSRSSVGERKDEPLTVKVDVHVNNGTYKPMGNGSVSSLRSEAAKDSGSEHAYEQICIRQDEQGSPKYAGSHKKLADNASDGSRSRKTDRRYSRSSSTSESSNMSSEVHYSSTTSTPSLSRNSSNERVSKSPKVPETLTERKNSTNSARAESEKETKAPISVPRPPPPPPPPPPELDEVVIVTSKVVESTVREEKKDGSQSTTQEQKCEATITTISAANKSAAALEDATTSCGGGGEPQEVPVGSSPPAGDEDPRSGAGAGAAASATTLTTTTTTTACQVTAHLVSRHMVLPFIPPKFANQAADSETLLKPSEYLRSICKAAGAGSTSTLSKARSVDNLDLQSRSCEEEVRKSEGEEEEQPERHASSGPPPPPLPPPPMNGGSLLFQATTTATTSAASDGPAGTGEPATLRQAQQQQQPLATISIQDLTSVQLRRTNLKMHATKTFSAPPNRSVSMTNVSESFFVQKTDLIAELKKTKDIPGIKKLKVQRAQVEKSQEQSLISEISKAFSFSKFVDQIPEKDSSGNVIPIWKRQMLARKAAERAKKELEEQIARENEQKRIQAIPPWKRQLLAKKDSEIKVPWSSAATPIPPTLPVCTAKIEVPITPKKEPAIEAPPPPPVCPLPPPPPVAAPAAVGTAAAAKPVEEVERDKPRNGDVSNDDDEDNRVHIIPWRAQLRKTNSKLNILD